MKILIYGASDDLLEIDGDVYEEYDCMGRRSVRLHNDQEKTALIVTAEFGPGSSSYARDASWASSPWSLEVGTDYIDNYAFPGNTWTIEFVERPDREGDPAISIHAPEGTVFTNLGEHDLDFLD